MPPEVPPYTLAIPTDGASPYLPALLRDNSDAAATVIVWTADGPPPPLPPGIIIVRDDRPYSIQEWWRTALAASPTDIVAVLNDDVETPPGTIARMVSALHLTGSTLAMLDNWRLTGWCFILDCSHGILPDPGYRWFFGDDDLLRRAALPPGRGVVRPSIPTILHHKFRTSEALPFIRAQFYLDRERFLRAPAPRPAPGAGPGIEMG